MSPYGEYKLSPDDNKKLNVVEFIEANWNTVWEIAEFPAPPLFTVSDLRYQPSTFFGGISLAGSGRMRKATLNTYDLSKDCAQFHNETKKIIPLLWSGPCAIARTLLVTTGVIPPDQLVDKETALRGGLHPNYLTWNDAGDDRYSAAIMDGCIAQGAIYDYIFNLSPQEKLDSVFLRKVMRMEKDEIFPSFFK